MNVNGVSKVNQYTAILAKQPQNKMTKPAEETPPAKRSMVDTIEITGVSEAEKTELERRAEVDKVSPKEALAAALAIAPNTEDVERSKALSAKFIPIQNKMLAGKPLTSAEKSFMQKNYPEWAAIAERVEREIQQLSNQVKNSGSSENARQIITQKKLQLMTAGKSDGFTAFMMPAIDRAFRSV